jgi:hypothetical protein
VACTNYPLGTFSPMASSFCYEKCYAGFFAQSGTSSCTACSAGSYSSYGSVTCTSCPSGQVSSLSSQYTILFELSKWLFRTERVI